MKVLIENEAGSDQKNIFDEKTLEYKRTHAVSRRYPYPYGFLLNTISGDGDNLDCFVLTTKQLKSREVIDVEPIGIMEQIEDGQEDHKILAVLPGEEIVVSQDVQMKLKDFAEHVFEHLEGKNMQVGKFYGKEAAIDLIKNIIR